MEDEQVLEELDEQSWGERSPEMVEEEQAKARCGVLEDLEEGLVEEADLGEQDRHIPCILVCLRK